MSESRSNGYAGRFVADVERERIARQEDRREAEAFQAGIEHARKCAVHGPTCDLGGGECYSRSDFEVSYSVPASRGEHGDGIGEA